MIFDYYYRLFRQVIPLFIFLYYVYNDGYKNRKHILLSSFIIGIILVMTIYLFFGYMSNIDFGGHIYLNWSYYASIEWCIYNICLFIYGKYRKYNNLFIINYMTQSTSAGGLIYEIPDFINRKHGYFFSNYLFPINFQIISIFILIWIIIKSNFKLNSLINLSLIVFIVYNILSFIYGWYEYVFLLNIKWLRRIPTMFFLYSIFTGLKPEYPN